MLKKIIISSIFALVSFSISSAQSPSNIVGKKLVIIGSVTELSLSINNQYYFTSIVNQVGRYNVGLSNEDWSLEKYHYRKTGEQTADLTIINYDGDQARLQLSFNSPTSGSVNGSYYNVKNELQWSTLDATWTVEDLDLTVIPDTELPPDPSGYYAPASIADGTFSAQDKYWSLYDETISFSSVGTFSASITNDDPGSPLSTSGTSYTYTKMGTNSAMLSYSIDGAGISFEYALQFTGENTGIYSKYANYGSEEDITTGPFSLSGVAVPEQYDWEDYDEFSSPNVDTSKWSMGHWDGGNLPTISSGKIVFSGNTVSGFKDVLPTAGMLSFNSGIGPLLEDAFSSTNGTQSHSYLELLNDDQILGIEVEVQLPAETSISTGIGLYASDWAKTFSEDQSENSFFGLDLRNDHIDIEYTDLNSGSLVSSELPTELGRSHIFAFIFEEQNVLLYVDGTKVAEFSSANFSRDSILVRAMNGAGEPFSAYAKNVRVLRQKETTEPEPVTVVSDPNGKAVVVQVGDEYKWNSSLDGVTLWGVEQSSDGWSSMTMRFENGRNFGNEGFYDSVAQPQPYDVTFEIDENGYIKSLEDDGDYQYYNAVSVENGVIGTIQNDEGVDSVASNGVNAVDQWFFTTRAAAEEYYYSKVNPKSWMWFDHYPWVYSNEQQDWLYFHPSGGTLMYFSNKGQAWRQFN